MGPKKVVVLAGYKTVKKALVNYSEEFGERDQMRILHEFNQGHGKEKEHFYKNYQNYQQNTKKRQCWCDVENVYILVS